MTSKKKAPSRKATAKKGSKPSILNDAEVKKGIRMLKDTEDVWDEKDLQEEIDNIKKQQHRLNDILSNLDEIEHGKVKNIKKTEKIKHTKKK